MPNNISFKSACEITSLFVSFTASDRIWRFAAARRYASCSIVVFTVCCSEVSMCFLLHLSVVLQHWCVTLQHRFVTLQHWCFVLQHCKVDTGSFTKDLSFVHKDLTSIIILDNSPGAYKGFPGEWESMLSTRKVVQCLSLDCRWIA